MQVETPFDRGRTLLGVLIAGLGLVVSTYAQDYEFVTAWGSSGTGDGEFNYPIGVTVDVDGTVYVAEYLGKRIQKFDPYGGFVTNWGSAGGGDGQFSRAADIAVDSAGNVYVTDYQLHRVQKFDDEGNYLTQWGTNGTGDGEFNGPWGIDIDGDDNIYVAEYLGHRIQKFDTNGTFLAKWGSSGSGDTNLYYPQGLGVDGDGNVYVSEAVYNRVKKFDDSGNYLLKWGSAGTGDGQFNKPEGVAIDSSGNVYVSDANNNRIQKFSTNGTFLTTWGEYGTTSRAFDYPWGVDAGPSGRIYVCDYGNDRMQVFAAAVEKNLVTDASFESPLPLNVPRGNDFFVDKLAVWDEGGAVDAADGSHILNYRCWYSGDQTVVLPQPFEIDVDTLSFTIRLRARTDDPVTIAFALYDATGQTNLMGLATNVHDGSVGSWVHVEANGLTVPGTATNTDMRLGFTVTAPAGGCEVDLDRAGVFKGNTIPAGGAVDNAEFHFVEAEDLANGTSWKQVNDAGAGNWPSGTNAVLKILQGYEAYGDPSDAVWEIEVETPGAYRAWCRLYHYNLYTGAYTVSVHQYGQTLASRTIEGSDEKYDPDFRYVWDSVDVELQPGTVEVHLSRPASGSHALTRRADALILANDLSYVPNVQDLVTPVYIRYSNTWVDGDPYCLWFHIYHQKAPYYTNVGMLSKAGERRGAYQVPGFPGTTKSNVWLAAGESTPWIRVTPYLTQFLISDRLRFVATRSSHATASYVTNHLSGTLEFAVGDTHQIISNQTITIDQDGSRFLLTMPDHPALYPDEILTSWEHFNVCRAVAESNKVEHPPIEHIEISTTFALDPAIDDYDLYTNEVALLRDIGMNNLTFNEPSVNKAALGLLPANGVPTFLLYRQTDGCYNQPDVTAIESALDVRADQWTNQTHTVTRANDGDERGVNTLEHVVAHDTCRRLFKGYLTNSPPGGLGLSLADLGIATWSQAVPIAHTNRFDWPALYYYTHMFRFDSFRGMAKLCQDEVHERFPNARNYNNVSDGSLGTFSTWVLYTDLYQTIRNGQGMGWTEDWIGWGAGPMQASCLYAMLRVACKPEAKPFGGYMIVKSGPKEALRTKLYELVSGGATYVCLYSYGPSYMALDDWSNLTDRYPTLMEVLAEFGEIDADLHGTTRRRADVAILYNRTAGIWESYDSIENGISLAENSWERDAQFIYWALRHAGYNVDVIPEEDFDDVTDDALTDYKVLYVNGVNIRQDTADTIASWLGAGSGRVLVGTAGVGAKDEKNQSTETLNTVFGISGGSLTRAQRAARPQFEMPYLTNLTEVTLAVPTETSFSVQCWREVLTNDTGTVIGEDTQANVVAVTRAIGGNTAIRYGFLPGVTYLHEAWDKTMASASGIAVGFDSEIRDAIAYGASLGATQLAETDEPLMEITRWDGTDRALIFLIDHDYDAFPKTNVTITIPDCDGTTKVTSAREGRLEFLLDGDELSVTLDMDRNTDVLTISRSPRTRRSTLIILGNLGVRTPYTLTAQKGPLRLSLAAGRHRKYDRPVARFSQDQGGCPHDSSRREIRIDVRLVCLGNDLRGRLLCADFPGLALS